MSLDLKRRFALGMSGLTAFAIGMAITLDPQSFYSSYGIVLPPQPNLMSELRAPAANLAALGLIILCGAFYQKLVQTSALLGAMVFSAFAVGRTISFVLDGWPSESILAAFAIEVFLAVLCLWVVGGNVKSAAPA
ncbi:DUF4345 domain-containing protein [Ruegeria sp. R13_0]|uniref:DUF4345 domain-containing protein n=1 Tax=Ruegeria sp. R13_0 TaxID=2821099 RepID=UPI001ADAED47|nr:DUF4345 domain-containing protein [Ruegeria sp. R13_0]MBO9436639.1 DUF4345 domain-containing protein [Ruegeria sp. R13_0]